MKLTRIKGAKRFAFLCGLLIAANAANASVLTFDDIGPGTFDIYSSNDVPNGYGGLGWTNVGYVNVDTLPTTNNGYRSGVVSGRDVAFNGFGHTAITSSASPFNFVGVYLAGVWNDGLNVRVQGFANGVVRYDRTVIASATSPTWFEFDFMNIDSVVFNSSGGTPYWHDGMGTNFAMDNFTYSPVPVPAAIWLLGSGLAAFVAVGRRKAT